MEKRASFAQPGMSVVDIKRQRERGCSTLHGNCSRTGDVEGFHTHNVISL